MVEQFREHGLIVNERLEEYNGTAAVSHQYLPAEDIEFLHRKSGALDEGSSGAGSSSTTLGFALRHTAEMLADTRRSCTLRYWGHSGVRR